jgi:hypothetical protein
MAGETRRSFGRNAHRVHRLRKRAEFSLHLHLQGEGFLLRLVETDDDFARVVCSLDIPGQHARASHRGHISFAAYMQNQSVELTLHHLAAYERGLAHQSWTHADLGQHLGGIKKFAFNFGRSFLPRQIHAAVCWQKAAKLFSIALRTRAAGELELSISC